MPLICHMIYKTSEARMIIRLLYVDHRMRTYKQLTKQLLRKTITMNNLLRLKIHGKDKESFL